MTSSTDGEGHTTQYQYNRAGNIAAIVDPTGEQETYLYDGENRLIQKTDRNGVTVEFGYNLYGAPLFRKEKNSTLGDFYEYTPEGLVQCAISAGMRYNYTYDVMGRMVEKSASGRALLAMVYDQNGNKVRQTDVTGKVTEYTYSPMDLLTTVCDDGGELAAYDYNPDGTVKALVHGPVRQDYTYDLDKNLVGLKVQSAGELLADNLYQYDGNGNRTRKQQLGGDTYYHYDPLNQLQRVEYPSYTEELFYDRAANRTRRIAQGVEELYRYDPRNRLISLTKGGVTTCFQYDNAGNLLADDKAQYSYDAFNRTIRAELFDGNVQVNRYDAEGLRYEMEENGNLVQFIFNLDREAVTEEDSTGLTRLIRSTELIARSTDAVRTYYHYASDEMGSTTHIVDEQGNVQNHYEYDAWGNLTVQEEAIPNRFKYTGQQLDPITQQYYLRARFYNPVIARFTQEDTYRGDGLNLYAYCTNNPVYYWDPSGHQPKCVKDIAQKLMKDDPNLSREDAYRRAYLENARTKLDPKKSKQLSARERYQLESRRARIIYHEAEAVTGMSRDDIRSIAHIGNDHNLQALAIYEQGGQRFFDVNSTARGPESQINNIINISATSPTGEITKLPHVRYQNRSGAHAEVGAMNQARLSGIQGGDATLTVIGYPICNDCRNTSVRTMAAVLNVDTLTVHDYLGNATSQFRGSQGEFFSSSKGGVTWSSGKISNYNPQYP